MVSKKWLEQQQLCTFFLFYSLMIGPGRPDHGKGPFLEKTLILPGLAISYRLHSTVFLQENALSPNLLMTLTKTKPPTGPSFKLGQSVCGKETRTSYIAFSSISIVALIPSTAAAGATSLYVDRYPRESLASLSPEVKELSSLEPGLSWLKMSLATIPNRCAPVHFF